MTTGMLGHAVPMFHDSIAESSSSKRPWRRDYADKNNPAAWRPVTRFEPAGPIIIAWSLAPGTHPFKSCFGRFGRSQAQDVEAVDCFFAS